MYSDYAKIVIEEFNCYYKYGNNNSIKKEQLKHPNILLNDNCYILMGTGVISTRYYPGTNVISIDVSDVIALSPVTIKDLANREDISNESSNRFVRYAEKIEARVSSMPTVKLKQFSDIFEEMSDGKRSRRNIKSIIAEFWIYTPNPLIKKP